MNSNPTRTARAERFAAKNAARKIGRTQVDSPGAFRRAREARQNYTDGTMNANRGVTFGAFGNATPKAFNELAAGTSASLREGQAS